MAPVSNSSALNGTPANGTPTSVAPANATAGAAQEQPTASAGEQPTGNGPQDSYTPSEPSDSVLDDIKRLSLFSVSSKGGEKPGAPTAFSQTVRDKFGLVDNDGDGHLSEKEINTALTDKNVKGDFAAAVATLKSKRDYLQGLSNDEYGPENDGVTEKDLTEFERLRANGDSDAANVDGRFADAQDRVNSTSRKLFAGGKPDPTALRQGGIGDCYLIAAASAKADKDPDGLKKMIDDNGDGTYTAHLGQGDQKVDAPTDGEIAFGATSGKDGLWGTVLEKAYAEKSSGETDGSKYDGLDGDTLGEGIKTMSGTGNDLDLLSATSLDETRSKLESAMADKRLVTAGIRGGMPFTDHRRDNGLPMGHAYSVTGYDRASDTVSVRNPWGFAEPKDASGNPADGKDDGVFTMPLSDFDKYYSTVAYEER